MPTTRFTTACGGLDFEARATRLAGYLWSRPEVQREPGICQVCGHGLPVAYSMHVPDPARPSGFRCEVCPPGTAEAAAMAARIIAGQVHEFRTTGVWTSAYHACGALDEAVWARARAINAERRAAQRAIARQGAGAAVSAEDAAKLRPRQPTRMFHAALPARTP